MPSPSSSSRAVGSTNPSRFKDSLGRFLTSSLFIEFQGSTPETALYTLKDEDETRGGVTYESLKDAFLGFSDPRGYYFAKTYFYNYEHYKRLLGNSVIRGIFDSWIEELELKLQADALMQLVTHSQGEKGQASAKWLAQCGWRDKGAGRPSKKQIDNAIKRETRMQTVTDQDYERIKPALLN